MMRLRVSLFGSFWIGFLLVVPLLGFGLVCPSVEMVRAAINKAVSNNPVFLAPGFSKPFIIENSEPIHLVDVVKFMGVSIPTKKYQMPQITCIYTKTVDSSHVSAINVVNKTAGPFKALYGDWPTDPSRVPYCTANDPNLCRFVRDG